MDYNHNWPVALRFGNHKYCGLQLRHLESETLIQKIQHLHLILMKPDTSKLMDTMLAWYQHVSGLTSPILERNPQNVNYINSCWLNDLVKLLKQNNIEIKLSNTHLHPIQRENDSFIMIKNSYSFFFFNNFQEISKMQIISPSYLTIRHHYPQRRLNSHN